MTDPLATAILDEIRSLRSLVESRLAPTGKPMSIARAAKHLGVSESFLRAAIADGRIKPTRQGRRVLIGPAELQRLQDEGVGKKENANC